MLGLVLLLAIAVLVAFYAAFGPLWWFGLGCLVALAAWDAFSVLREPRFGVKRYVTNRLPVGLASAVTIELTGGPARQTVVRVHDHHPESFDVDGLPLHTVALGTTRIDYDGSPRQRGEQTFRGTELRTGSPRGLWWRQYAAGSVDSVRVYPNFKPVLGHMRLG
nr:hypothetical protein [Gammaproteobacteria bacterium]